MADAGDSLGRVGVIVAARTGSTRLPGKALRPLGGKPMILFLLERIRASREADAIVFATTELADDDGLAGLVESAGYSVFRGAGEDVVQRYVTAARLQGFDYVVRVTGDCPFVDAESLDYCVAQARAQAPFDLASTKGEFPVGIDYDIYRASVMEELHAGDELDARDREHLTLFMYGREDRFSLVRLIPRPEWCSSHSFTVDTLEDYRRVQNTVARVGESVTIAELAAVAT